MKRLLDSPRKEHRAILDARLASYRAGASKVISHAELMRRVRAKPKDTIPFVASLR